MDAEPVSLPTIDDVRAAAARLAGLAVRTPLIENAALSERFGGRILFKPEVLQRTGSFKFRGAYNKIAALPEAVRAKGIIAYSSGNHAQGVAAAAGMFGAKAVIVMPSDAPCIKIDNVRALGGEVVLYDRLREQREVIAEPYVERGMALAPPFDDPMIVAGQGTIGLELVEQAEAQGARLDAVVAPCGGGGLISGIATAVKALSPDTEVWAAEPENFDDMRRSLESGRREIIAPGFSTICDAIMTPQPGVLTFAINRRLLAGAVAVSDAGVAQAMRDAAAHLKLVVEPGGSAGFAALSTGGIDLRGRTVAVVLSGGNVDLSTYAQLLAR